MEVPQVLLLIERVFGLCCCVVLDCIVRFGVKAEDWLKVRLILVLNIVLSACVIEQSVLDIAFSPFVFSL